MGFLSLQSIIPPGTIFPYAGAAAPAGWVLCNGGSYATSAQPALFAAIGYTYGGSGANFNVPDTRGIFLRGAGTNPNNAANTTTIGARQLDDFKSHSHTYNQGSVVGRSNGGDQCKDGVNTTPSTGLSGGTETRPANVGVNYIIKL